MGDPLEPVEMEELDALEVLEEENFQSEAPQVARLGEIPAAARPFINSTFPVLLLDSSLVIHFANESCDRLFTGYFSLAGSYFTDAFGRAMGPETVKELREAVHSGKSGFSWKGTVKVKTREAGTLMTKVYLFPAGFSEKLPEEFIILFDDVTEENRRLLKSVFASLLEASKLKDNDTGRHIIRVNLYARRLAEELYNKRGYEQIDRDFIEDIGFLASMHDVGKIGTPDDILNKEGPLNDWEWTIMREHTKNGAFILSTYPNPMAREIALNHHECWDGSGYPFQKEGEMIPLSARIVTFADVYDALRMKRSYKQAFSHEKAVQQVRDWRGTHFDPALVDDFQKVSGDFERIYAENAD